MRVQVLPHHAMRTHIQTRILVVAAVVMIAGSVWLASEAQRSAANNSFLELQHAEQLLDGMIDQDAALHEFQETRDPASLAPYRQGRRAFEVALADARANTPPGEAEEIEALAEQERLARRWENAADAVLARMVVGQQVEFPSALRTTLADFREVNAEFREDIIGERTADQKRAGVLAVGLIVALSVLFAAIGYVLIDRRVRRDTRGRERQTTFKNALTFARTEEEVYEILRRHVDVALPGSEPVVLNRNNSADALEPRTALPEDSRLHETLRRAQPDSCLAIRSGQPYESSPNGDGGSLLTCAVCGGSSAYTTCVPSLVRGEVIGAVLLDHPRRLRPTERELLRVSVAEAAPVIGHVRTLTLAEMRAATDALTGLPNSRTVQETLARLVAQASRTVTPLAAILFDLDHFKRINDVLGHAKGDEVLAAVGDAVGGDLRESDFIGRYGGEEFLALLPNTGRDGALVVAEKLRETISELHVPGIERSVTASFGVAVFPDDAVEGAQLLRLADRALYIAKEAGRNRVETASPEPTAVPIGALE
jgi:diguanylate cyclase (GGDEF)-like protein